MEANGLLIFFNVSLPRLARASWVSNRMNQSRLVSKRFSINHLNLSGHDFERACAYAARFHGRSVRLFVE